MRRAAHADGLIEDGVNPPQERAAESGKATSNQLVHRRALVHAPDLYLARAGGRIVIHVLFHCLRNRIELHTPLFLRLPPLQPRDTIRSRGRRVSVVSSSARAARCAGSPNKCTQRPRGTSRAEGSAVRATPASAGPLHFLQIAKPCMRSVRPRSSPMSGRRATLNAQQRQFSTPSRLNTSPMTMAHFSTRCPAPLSAASAPYFQ